MEDSSHMQTESDSKSQVEVDIRTEETYMTYETYICESERRGLNKRVRYQGGNVWALRSSILLVCTFLCKYHDTGVTGHLQVSPTLLKSGPGELHSQTYDGRHTV